MNADTLANVIQVVATLIALVGLAVTFVFSYQGQRLQKQQATEAAAQAAESNKAAQAAAQRAAASAALTIDDLARIAAALERLAAEPRPTNSANSAGSAGSRFEAPAAPATVAWELTHDGGDSYRLTNAGAAPAFDVWVGGAASLDGPHDLPPTEQVVAGASVAFRAAVVPTTVDQTITVTWASSHGGADRSSWRYPLPGA